MKKLLFLLILHGLFLPAYAQLPNPLKDIDSYVKRVMADFNVPGLGLSVTKDGAILLSKGYGVRSLGSPEPVDAHTLFGIASNSKAFTAAALALLVEEGKIEWDAPVINYLPWFRLSDPWVTSQITVRDLLVHRSGLGLGAGDLLLWPATTYSRREVAERLRNVPLAYSFRSRYAYDNVLYLVAGVLIEEMSGLSWEQFIQTRIFNSLGMHCSTPSVYSVRQGNIASTHAFQNGILQVVEHDTSSNANPAGGIGSCAADMARWMQVLLDSGKTGSSGRLFSAATTSELWNPVTPLPMQEPAPGLEVLRMNYRGYALGFRVNDYRGLHVVSHTGTLTGYVSRMFLVPELRLGITVLTNQENTDAYDAIIYRIVDRYLKVADFDWPNALISAKQKKKENQAQVPRPPSKSEYGPPSLPLQSFAGTYSDKWYGDIRISLEAGKLLISFLHTPQLTGTLEHWQHNTFVARWYQRDLRADAFVTFQLGSDDSVERIRMKAFLPDTDFSYDFQDLDPVPVKEE
jgi:CubicO group peptidase (beta-lactamase class C family)